jgi:ubiquinone/menaquinone biosynthesis C-methylase UbiE
MSGPGATTAIGPEAYASWRATSLGSITESIEQHLILDLTGELAGRRVLDVGCGDGALACAAASRRADVTGIDPDLAMLVAARSRAARVGVHVAFLEGRVEQLPFPDTSLDVVVSVTVLCFVPDAAAAVREMARVLRPGGRLVLGELGRWSLWAAVRRIRGWLGASTWKAARFHSATELRALAEQAGLRVMTIRAAVYYPPVGVLARILAPLDPWFARATTVGAAFVALSAISADQYRSS